MVRRLRLEDLGRAAMLLPAAFWMLTALPAASNSQEIAQQLAAPQILQQSGVRGGLIVHLGCGDGQQTVALRVGDGCLAHGLDASAEQVGKAREHIQSLGLYGSISSLKLTTQAPRTSRKRRHRLGRIVQMGESPGIRRRPRLGRGYPGGRDA